VPVTIVTLRPVRSPESPLKRPSTTACLRRWLTAKSVSTAPVVNPNSFDRSIVRCTWAVSRNSLAGTQPRCRHVPPTFSRSTIAMFSPADAP